MNWFKAKGLNYPWGDNPTPYRVWISEVMLQQTLIKAVLPFYVRWMKCLPNVASLAQASERFVLQIWEGLGYYNRARNLRKAAQIIVDDFGGHFPATLTDWLTLPGIGPYSGRAILSIAFGQPYPLIDANVKRITERFLACHLEKNRQTESALYAWLSSAMPASSPGPFNSALMQLGQLVCKNRKPLCDDCPLSDDCAAYQSGRVNQFPKIQQKGKTLKHGTLALIACNNRFLLKQRQSGIGRGLYAFPYLSEVDFLSLPSRGWQALPERTHNYTHFQEKLSLRLFRLSRESKVSAPFVWVSTQNAHLYPMPTVYRKIVKQLIIILYRKPPLTSQAL